MSSFNVLSAINVFSFSQWKFAVLSLGRPEYLLDSDIVCNRVQRRDDVRAWEQYLGLEHSDTVPERLKEGNQLFQSVPKKSYAANQVRNFSSHAS
ncbi:hypothetical protein RHMOL_Rhmol05G0240000 [Rhododendron molle]|uniref:Uncharacterized protein n=1 Tax=Rhododendron molle TaxID=49168 RepID=A0ACC0NSN3_RHOML|nr:hypothetical protein RHMOL_Rhmol05G0240000 [Rhododendron molle]